MILSHPPGNIEISFFLIFFFSLSSLNFFKGLTRGTIMHFFSNENGLLFEPERVIAVSHAVAAT